MSDHLDLHVQHEWKHGELVRLVASECGNCSAQFIVQAQDGCFTCLGCGHGAAACQRGMVYDGTFGFPRAPKIETYEDPSR